MSITVTPTTPGFFAEISGSAVADIAATGPIIIPAMKKAGYPGPFTAALTSSSSRCSCPSTSSWSSPASTTAG